MCVQVVRCNLRLDQRRFEMLGGNWPAEYNGQWPSPGQDRWVHVAVKVLKFNAAREVKVLRELRILQVWCSRHCKC